MQPVLQPPLPSRTPEWQLEQTAVRVTITNMPEPAPQCVYIREAVAARSPTIYGVTVVSEENKLVPVASAPATDKWGNPLPLSQS